MPKIDKRKLIDWKKKSKNDDSRISKRLEGRSNLLDSITTTNDTQTKIAPPRGQIAPLLRLRRKIKEAYDEEDEDEEDIVSAPFFNITLLDDDEREYDGNITKKERKNEDQTIKIVKEQQIVSKMNVIMDTALQAQRAGIKSQITAADRERVNSASYEIEDLRRKTLYDKIEKPLDLKGHIKEKDLEQTIKGIKRAQNELPADSLNNMPTKNVAELNTLDDTADMAKLILEKSGRQAPSKKLSEIVQEKENRKHLVQPNTSGKEKE